MTDKTNARRILKVAFEDFAIGAEEAATAAKIEIKEARRLLRHMEGLDLIASTHVNDEKALTYQSTKTYDNHEWAEVLADFKALWVEPGTRRDSTGTPRNDTAAHQAGNYRVVYVNKAGKVTARGERTRGTKAQVTKIAKQRNASKGPRETGRWEVRRVERNAR